jgi:hypothetical protein
MLKLFLLTKLLAFIKSENFTYPNFFSYHLKEVSADNPETFKEYESLVI